MLTFKHLARMWQMCLSILFYFILFCVFLNRLIITGAVYGLLAKYISTCIYNNLQMCVCEGVYVLVAALASLP